MSFSIGSLTVGNDVHDEMKSSNVSSDSPHSIQVGSISALLNFCRLVCSTYDPHRNFSFEGNLILSFTDCVSNCRTGCI